ncbi:ABC transporter substrate-binding protein [Paramicrobacterium chengjingii]|uniref:ABC transporter substrate-binding protein n=1 Tax=Paramicrobacterium chengjingii TaxID=2769067 RepID=A0ABX6YG16_9MICO|nr:ABC transporter substrate-binding protein [Microbacterium chengjingii]QPZ37337.1 ABC transporter substrate-binding protein [Microbacterium chengjingii]
MNHRITRAGVALLALAALALSACSAPTEAAPEPSSATDAWPRTVTLDDRTVTIDETPQRVVALSTETGDIALELIGHERVAAVSHGSITDGAGNQIAEAELVETALPAGTNPDPEQILALDPDLVLMTSRHEGEQDAANVLSKAGVPALIFDSSDFESIDAVMAAVKTIGSALGAESTASDIVSSLTKRQEHVLDAIADDPIDSTVLLLMSRGGRQFVQSASSTMSTLVEQAGGTVIGASDGAVPAGPESIVAANPDVIIVEDFQGAGLSPFSELLESGALADVPAIADDATVTVSASIASGTSGTRTVEGLEAIASILHPDAEL